MQKLSNNVSGSSACFVKIGKELEALIEKEGACEAWLALPVADDCWLDLSKIICGDRNMPVLSTESEKSTWRRNLVKKIYM